MKMQINHLSICHINELYLYFCSYVGQSKLIFIGLKNKKPQVKNSWTAKKIMT